MGKKSTKKINGTDLSENTTTDRDIDDGENFHDPSAPEKRSAKFVPSTTGISAMDVIVIGDETPSTVHDVELDLSDPMKKIGRRLREALDASNRRLNCGVSIVINFK